MGNIKITDNARVGDGRYVDVAGLLDLVRNDRKTEGVCRFLRRGGLADGDADRLKGTLQCAYLHGVCDGIHSRSNFEEFTGYMFFDLDDEVDYGRIRSAMRDDGVLRPVALWDSPRGKLRVLLSVPQVFDAPEGVGGEDWFKHIYRCVSTYISRVYGIMPDQQCNDITRICYLSHDDDPWYDSDEPATEVPIAEYGSEESEVEYCAEFGDKAGGVRSGTGRAAGGYDSDKYIGWLEEIGAGLVRGEDGDYVYDHSHKVFVGSRSEGTAGLRVGEYSGYSLKFRISVCAVWLYGGNLAAAQSFVDRCFEDSRHKWNACTRSHASYPPQKDVLLWLLREFGFERIGGLPATTFEFVSDSLSSCGGRSVSAIADKWDDIKTEHGIPRFFDWFMSDSSASAEQRDLRLYSAIVTVSGFTGTQRVWYNQKACGLNVVLNVVGSAASGKGEMLYAPKVLLRTFDDKLSEWVKSRMYEYRRDMAEWKRSSRNTTVSYGDGDDGEGDSGGTPMPVKPPYFVNTVTLSTTNGLAELLSDNNGKLLFVNTEYSNVTKMEKSPYGGLLSNFKNIFDNDTIGSVSAKDLRDGSVTVVHEPVCAALVSGTFGQFGELYTSYEDGMLSRSIYYIVPDTRFSLRPLKPYKPSEDRRQEIELEFLQWYMYNHFNPGVQYSLDSAGYEKLKAFVDPMVNRLAEAYDSRDSVSNAVRSLFYRYVHNVVKVAAILQSFADFEREVWDGGGGMSCAEWLSTPSLSRNEWFEISGDFTFDSWASLQVGGMPFPDEDDRNVYQDRMKYGVDARLEYNYVEAAFKILAPSLVYGIQMMESYRREDVLVKDVNPVKGTAKYIALELCGDEFRFTDYKDAIAKLKGRDAHKQDVSRKLKQLEEEGRISRDDESKTYRKL